MPLGGSADAYPHAVARAVETLRHAGIAGLYALAIGPEGYLRIVETTDRDGHLLQRHLKEIPGGDVVWAPGLNGVLVLSMRGGDFTLDIGQDFSVGYTAHDGELVTLYLEESFSFRVAEPDAAVVLTEG